MLPAFRWLTGIAFWLLPVTLSAQSAFEVAVQQTADQAADALAQLGATSVMPRFEGFQTMAAGGGAGFAEIVKERLAPRGIRIGGRAEFALITHLEWTDDFDGSTVLQLVSEIRNDRGRKVGEEIRSYGSISDGKDLAEILGVPVHFGPLPDAKGRRDAFFKDFEDVDFHAGEGDRQLASHTAGLYRLAIRVNGQSRQFVNRDRAGLPYTNLDFGDVYTLVLTNNSNHEAAVDLKVDGLNVFYFSDPDAVRSDGSKYKYWIVKPHGTLEVKGWHKNDRRTTQFQITPIEEGAAAQAGIPFDDVGLVTATFYASWPDKGSGQPSDEPSFERMMTVTRSVPELMTRLEERTRTRSDGRTEAYTVEVPYTVMKEVYETRVSTGFGTEVLSNSVGVDRIIGVPRATLAFRYDRRQ